MSFAANLAFKMACIFVIASLVIGVMVGFGAILNSVVGSFDASLPSAVLSYLQMGRELVNNFIPADIFNFCVSAWFLAFPLGVGIYFTKRIQDRLLQV